MRWASAPGSPNLLLTGLRSSGRLLPDCYLSIVSIGRLGRPLALEVVECTMLLARCAVDGVPVSYASG